MSAEEYQPEDVLGFWFPDNDHAADEVSHRAFWSHRMQGGVDEEICARFAGLTEAAARGLLDHWAEAPYGRLALIIALDQFPRSLWRDTPAAYGQDIKATRLAMAAFDNGHYDALAHVWEKQFLLIAIGHCEGPDHLARCDLLVEKGAALAESAPPHMREMYAGAAEMPKRVREIIARFGRHPHRNPILGRISTPEEEAYIEAGDFPHNPPELKQPAG